MNLVTCWRIQMKFNFFQNNILGLLFSLVCFGIFGLQNVSAQDKDIRKFTTPDLAFKALIDAAKSKKPGAVLAILGEDNKEWLTSGDPVQDQQGIEAFIKA
ncbi:MAG: DUF2950 family protein, partial [Desulfobulbia bacterium]